MSEMMTLLKSRMPFKWKVQISKYNTVDYVSYVDSRQVQDRLDEVFGPDWSDEYKEINGNLYCGITATIDGVKTTRWDCGIESKESSEKGEASDAFKRAAVKFGVGRFLYDNPIVKFKKGTKTFGNKEIVFPCDKQGTEISKWEVQEACMKKAEWMLNK